MPYKRHYIGGDGLRKNLLEVISSSHLCSFVFNPIVEQDIPDCPSITLVVITQHISNPSIFNTKFQLNFTNSTGNHSSRTLGNNNSNANATIYNNFNTGNNVSNVEGGVETGPGASPGVVVPDGPPSNTLPSSVNIGEIMEITIGRHVSCDVVLNYTGISSLHARLQYHVRIVSYLLFRFVCFYARL